MDGGKTKRHAYNTRLDENSHLQDHSFAGYKKLAATESASGDFAGFFTTEDSEVTAVAKKGDSMTAEAIPSGMYIPFQTRNITCVSGTIWVAYNV